MLLFVCPSLHFCRAFSSLGCRVAALRRCPKTADALRSEKEEENTGINIICGTFREHDFRETFDAVFVLFGDFCSMTDPERAAFLDAVRKSLKPGGAVVFDVTTPDAPEEADSGHNWIICGEEHPRLVFQKTFHYPEHNVTLEQYAMIHEDATMSIHRKWRRDFSGEEAEKLLKDFGLSVETLWGDLLGSPPPPDPCCLWIVGRKE